MTLANPSPGLPSPSLETGRTAPTVRDESPLARARRRAMSAFPALLVVAFLLLPWPLMDKLRAIGSTVCMLRPSHSYFLAGQQLPLEARTQGIYAGLLLGLGYLLLRRAGATRRPSRLMMVVLGGFVASMAFDGLNSTAYDVGLPYLYAPTNFLRLVTGLLAGAALAPALLYLLSISLWDEGQLRPVIGGVGELAGLVLVEALFLVAIVFGPGWLLYPISLITAGGVVVAFFVVTLAVVVSLARDRWSRPLLINVALLFTVAELGVLVAYKLWFHQCPVPM
ncbi:MAG TPA: DUF2085 domain-containing protein [Anaerolineae bacterium]|nr:DUF2085 domain-containing protein [Anaerolineae bacterium]